jgi:sodium-dependent dicarboxylate transporter 2/3/5
MQELTLKIIWVHRFPLLGVADTASIVEVYFSPTIALMFGALLLAEALQAVDLTRRLSLEVVTRCTSPRALLLGMMGVTFFVSMFMSNTATAGRLQLSDLLQILLQFFKLIHRILRPLFLLFFQQWSFPLPWA